MQASIRVLLGVHAAIDAVHACAVIWGTPRSVEDLYLSLFQDHLSTISLIQDEEEDQLVALVRRLLCYWTTAMSLVRAMACIYASLWGVCALMYMLEALALQNELRHRTVLRRQARVASLISMALSAALVWATHAAVI